MYDSASLKVFSSQVFTLKHICIYGFFHTRYMSCPSQSSRFKIRFAEVVPNNVQFRGLYNRFVTIYFLRWGIGGLVAQAIRRLPQTVALGSRVRVSVTSCGFRGGRNGIWVGFLGVSPVFPNQKFHSIISPHSSRPFRFISFFSLCDGASDGVDRHPC